MRAWLAVAAVVAAASTAASEGFKHPAAQVFNTWDLNGEVKYVEDFADVAMEFGMGETAAEESHSRKKRSVEEQQARLIARTRSLPITKSCERPGYTGQFCEFPICQEENPSVDPEQWLTDTGYYVDITYLSNCTRVHTIIVDDTMKDLRIEIESTKDNDPVFTLTDSRGNTARPSSVSQTLRTFDATYYNLSPGVYSVVPTTLDESGHCFLAATSHTDMSVSGGFTKDDGRDRSDFPMPNAVAHAFNTIVFHGNNLRSPGKLTTVEIIGPQNYHFRNRILDSRFGCTFDYYFDSLFCYAEGSYSLAVEGIDHNGNLFRRAATFVCFNGPQPSTAAPVSTASPAPITRCGHGGVLLINPDNSTFCFCVERWTGRTCMDPICVNGGTHLHEDDGDMCVCPIGFGGLHCEEVHCAVEAPAQFDVDRPIIVLVLRIRQQMNEVIGQIRDALKKTVENLAFDSEYVSRFHLVFFNNDRIHLNSYFDNWNSVLTQLNRAALSAHSEGGCTDTVFGSIASSLTDVNLNAKSTVYVVTDALADDHEEYLESVYQWNSYSKATLNFIYVDPVDTNCTSEVSAPGFRAFENIANRFNGLAWHISKRSDVNNVVFNHMDNLLYRTQLMLTVDRDECSHGLLKTIDVTRANEQIIIVSHGQEFFPFLTDPHGESVLGQLEELVNHHGYFGLWRLKSPLMGQYILKGVTSPPTASCSFRVYQASYKSAGFVAQPEIFWAVARDIDNDVAGVQPVVGAENHIVFHLTQTPIVANPDRVFVALNIYAVRQNTEMEVYASNGYWRSRCSYNFYFPAFPCKYPNELLHFEFNFRDEWGFYLQRGGSMYCSNLHPTVKPPTACQNGGVSTSNGTCLCQPHYAGDRCERILCENGGSQQGTKCSCTPGWTGVFCSLPQCPTPGKKPTYGYHVDMAFIFEKTKRGMLQVDMFSKLMTELLRDITGQHPEWVDRFVLISYDEKGAELLIDQPANDYGPFMDAVKALLGSNTQNEACVVQSWEAIKLLLRERVDGRGIPRRSVINLYQTGIPDNFDGAALATDVSDEMLQKNVMFNLFQATNGDNGNSWYCFAKESDFRYQQQAARRGDGRMYSISKFDGSKAIFMIPTLFSASNAYKFSAENCTTPQTVFFPIDAHTQTVTAVIAGYQSVVRMQRYDGDEWLSDRRVDIFSNYWENVVEFRNPCDDQWSPLQQNCMHYNNQLGNVSFADATDQCRGVGAFLVDAQNDQKNTWLRTKTRGEYMPWLGLELINGTWWWIQDANTRNPVTFTNWFPNNVVPTDPAKPCAYFDSSDRSGFWWKASACDAKYRTICQKHRFDQNNSPSKIGDDDISPGKYFFTVQTDKPADPNAWNGCTVEVRIQSDVQVEFGFVDDLRRDDPNAFANIDSTTNRVVASVFLGQGRSSTSVMKHVMLRSDDANSTLLEASPMTGRIGCSYEYYSDLLSCEQIGGNDFQVVHIGEDESGNTFQRYSTSHCRKWVDACDNGGVYSAGACVCPEYFTGDRCQFPICQHGGTLDGRRCLCPTGYGGHACQHPLCGVNSNATFSNDGKTLVLLVESSTATKAILDKLTTSITAIVATATAEHPGWFTNYLVHSFLPDGTRDQSFMTSDLAALSARIATIATTATEPPKCQLPLYEAMADMFNFWSSLDGAEILLITTSVPIDNDNDNVFKAQEQFGTHSPYVDFIQVASDDCPVTDWTSNLTNFGHFIHNTGGVMFRVKEADFVPAIGSFLATRYAPQRLTYSDIGNCGRADIYIQVDVNMTDVYLASSGKKATLSIIDPKGGVVDDLDLLHGTTIQSLWHFNPGMPGTYKIQMAGTDVACFPSVWGNGGVQVIFGFIQNDNNIDDVTPHAVTGMFNYPVFHLVDPDDSGFIRGSLYRVNMARRTGVKGDTYKSDVNRRENCAYGHVGEAFLCPDDVDQVLTLSVSGIDTRRQPFTRMITTWCRSPLSPSAAPSTARPLTPKDIPLDVLFLVDETEDEKFINSTAIPFITNFMAAYTVGQQRARVGLITLPTTDSRSMPISFLSSVVSDASLVQNLLQFDDFLDDGGDVEYVTQALRYARFQYSKAANGYRDTINNHLIVLLTANTNFADLPTAVNEASNIVSSKLFGFVTIGFGNKVQGDKLQQLAGPSCTFLAPDVAFLTGSVTSSIQAAIWKAQTTTGGVYCPAA